MELNYNWKYRDYELRACPRTLTRLNKEDQNETIDLIKWETSKEDSKRYCFSLAYWQRDKEGFDLTLVGTRIFDEIEEDDVAMVWEQLHTAQLVLDIFWETEYKLNQKEWR
jgi:hypothetical protein